MIRQRQSLAANSGAISRRGSFSFSTRRTPIRIVICALSLMFSGCERASNLAFGAGGVGCEASQYRGDLSVRRPFHDNSDGIALSPDGKTAALTIDGDLASQVSIVDLESLKGIKIFHPNRSITLDNPTFSPDGKLLAVVASPSGLHGVAKIWLLSLNGGVIRTLGQPSHGYRLPSFSPDGLKLAYWRDVASPSLPGATLKNEDRQSLPWGMFEFDLKTATERRLSDKVYGVPCGIFYDTRSDGFYYCALELLKSRKARDGRSSWASTDGAFEYSEYLRGARTFYFAREATVRDKPEPFFREHDMYSKMAAVRGVTRDGAILLQSSIGDQESEAKFSSAAVWYRNQQFELGFHLNGDGIVDPVPSTDGSTILAKQERLDRKTCTLSTFYHVVRGGRVVKSFRANDITFAASPKPLLGRLGHD